MKALLSIASLLILTGSMALAQIPKREYTAGRTVRPPKIDAVLDDDTWKGIAPATDLIQFDHVFGAPATKRTDVKVAYDDFAIYVCAMMYDNAPDSILHELGSRDNTNINADLFEIGFDTYNHQDPYVFGLTASGVQVDVKNQDDTYDAVWESAVKINQEGWALEMKIPYSAIRFPSLPEQEWGFQAIRIIRRTQEYDQWASTPKTASNSRLYWGKLKGISNIHAPVRLSCTPFLTVYAEKAPLYETGNNYRYTTAFSYNAGADLKYGIDEKFTLDLTLLPDFSQVQSDNKVKNLSYQEVTYNENRQFFKEGTDLFNQNNLFYSRRIGKTPMGFYSIPYLISEGEVIKENPSTCKLLNAFKISGRNNNGLGIGFFNALTDNMYAVVEDTKGNRRKILTEPLTNYNAIVFDQQLKHNSSMYFMNTNVIRDKKYYDANVTGIGWSFQNKKNSYGTDGNAAFSQKLYKNDTLPDNYLDKTGYMYFLGVRKISGNFQWGLSHTLINKTYDSRDLGYQVVGNRQRERIYLDYNIYKPNKYFREAYNEVLFDYVVNPETGLPGNCQTYFSQNLSLLDYSSFNFVAQASPVRPFDYYEPRVAGRYFKGFRYYFLSAGFDSDSRRKLQFGFYGNFGDFLESFHGTGYQANPYVRYRFNDKTQVRYSFSYNVDNYNIGFANIDGNSNIIFGGRRLVTYENTLNLQYLFKNDMSLNFNARHYWNTGEYKKYFTLQEDGSLLEYPGYQGNHNFNYNVFNVDVVFSWQFAPGSLLSLVYKNASENEKNELVHGYFKDLDRTFDAPQSNSISLKVLYYLDYQYLRSLGQRSRHT